MYLFLTASFPKQRKEQLEHGLVPASLSTFSHTPQVSSGFRVVINGGEKFEASNWALCETLCTQERVHFWIAPLHQVSYLCNPCWRGRGRYFLLVGIRLLLRERLCMKLDFIGMLSCSRTLCRHFPCSKNEVKNLELLKKVRDTVFYNLEQGTCWIIRFCISIQKWTRIPDRLLAHIHIPPLSHRLESLKAKERKLQNQ